MGAVAAPHGIKGWLKLKVFTASEESLGDYETWWLTHATFKEPRPFVVEAFEVRPNGVFAKLAGIDDRNSAESLPHAQIQVPRTALPTPTDDEAYWLDLIGLTVVTPEGAPLGVVDSLFETPAHDVLVVLEGETERLIPAVDEIILEVDWEARIMKVDWQRDY
jgi:16S rRNA processing protein RimM